MLLPAYLFIFNGYSTVCYLSSLCITIATFDGLKAKVRMYFG